MRAGQYEQLDRKMYERSKISRLQAASTMVALCSVIGVGCSPPLDPAVRTLASSTHCSANVSGLKLLPGAAGLVEAFPRGTSLGAADYALEHVLLVGLGEKSTAGHELVLGASEAELQEGEAVIKLAEKAPGEVDAAAQVVSRPCIAVAVSRGDYDAIRVDSSSGESLGKVEIADE